MSNINKKIRYTWGAKICIALFLVGCTAQIYALVKVIMEGV